MTEVGGFTFLPQDGPADWEPGGAAWQRSAAAMEAVAEMTRAQAGDGAQPSSQELCEARRWAAQQTADAAAKQIERLAASLERLLPTMDGVERARCEAAASAYRESARIVREEGCNGRP